MTDKDEPGVYGFQAKLPRTFSSISNPKISRKDSAGTEAYYKQRYEIAEKIKKATQTSTAGQESAQKKIKMQPNSKSKQAHKAPPPPPTGTGRGTNISNASSESNQSLNSFSISDFGESDDGTVKTENDKSAGSVHRGADTRKKTSGTAGLRRLTHDRKDSAHLPSLSNQIGRTSFDFEIEEGFNSPKRDTEVRGTRATVNILQNELENGDLGLDETLKSLHVVKPEEKFALQSSYHNLMSGNLNAQDYESDDEGSERNDDDEDNHSGRNKRLEEKALTNIAHVKTQYGMGSVTQENASTLPQTKTASQNEPVTKEPLGKNGGIKAKSRRAVEDNVPIPPKMSSFEYSQDLSPDMIRISLKKIDDKGGPSTELGNKKLHIKPVKSGKNVTAKGKPKRKSTLGEGIGKCVVM